MDISIIIPVYKVEEYIGECIRSVMGQTGIEGLNVECIVVDDCSPDESIARAHEALEGYVGPIEFRFITREANGGLSAARNTGIRSAHGEYLYFLDSDDLITPNCLSRLWHRANEYRGVDIVYGAAKTFPTSKIVDQWLDLRRLNLPSYCNESRRVREAHIKIPEIACNRLIRRALIIDYGLWFKEGLIHEDYYWHLQAYQYVNSYATIDAPEKPTYLYRQRADSIMGKSNDIGRMLRSAAIEADVASQASFSDRPLTLFFYHKSVEYYFSRYLSNEQKKLLVKNMSLAMMTNSKLNWRIRFVGAIIRITPKIARPRFIEPLIKLLVR